MKLRVILLSLLLLYGGKLLAGSDTLSLKLPAEVVSMPKDWVAHRSLPKLSASDKEELNASAAVQLVRSAYANPAFEKFSGSADLTRLSAGWEKDMQQGTLIPQLGNGAQAYRIDADTRVGKGSYVVWGNAYYTQGERSNVRWSESSDFSVVYPYVMADSIGGDMNHETYYFLGGYAKTLNRFTFGLQLDYRAMLEYRTVDPRPRNTVADLNVRAGVVYSVSNTYSLGVGGLFRKYKQNSGVSFYSPQGKTPVVHLIGMGMRYLGQGSGEVVQFYNGNSYGASLDLIPSRGYQKKVGASVSYQRFTFEKGLDGLNSFPLNELREDVLRGDLFYVNDNTGDYKGYGVKLSMLYKNRAGTENLPGNPDNGVYPVLTSMRQYTCSTIGATASVFYAHTLRIANRSVRWSVQPKAGYTSVEERYKIPANSFTASAVSAGVELTAGSRAFFRADKLTLDFGYTYSRNLTYDLTLNNNGSAGLNATLTDMYSLLASSYSLLQASLCYSYDINRRNTVYLRPQLTYGDFSNGSSRSFWQLSLGYWFW